MARTKDTPDKPEAYRARWKGWVDDPLIAKAGVTFDRTPSGPILAPKGRYRVCAYHVDFDERPTCWMDVETLAEAKLVCGRLGETCPGWNVDYAVAYDDAGRMAVGPPWGG